MMRRREFNTSLLGITSLSLFQAGFGSTPRVEDSSFEAILEELRRRPDLLEAARTANEGAAMTDAQKLATKAIRRPRTRPSVMRISDRAANLIVLCEVTSEATYQQKYRRPVRPGGQSGITIGVGYDLGYVTTQWLEEDWGRYTTSIAIEQLRPACGLRGGDAHSRLADFREIDIPWSSAWPQFREVVLPRFVGETSVHLPNCDRLSPDCLGALTSLTFNRGASYSNSGSRYREMRNIRKHMLEEAYDRIPAEILSMQRLWIGKKELRGVVLRREAEARLFQEGLTSDGDRT